MHNIYIYRREDVVKDSEILIIDIISLLLRYHGNIRHRRRCRGDKKSKQKRFCFWMNDEKEYWSRWFYTGTFPHVHKLVGEHVVGRDLRVCLCYLVHRGAAFAYRGRFSLLFLSSRWFRKRKRNTRERGARLNQEEPWYTLIDTQRVYLRNSCIGNTSNKNSALNASYDKSVIIWYGKKNNL